MQRAEQSPYFCHPRGFRLIRNTIVFDDDYKELCPWAHIVGGEHVWPKELTDAAVELFESEMPNREYRKKKRSASETGGLKK